MKKLLTFLCVLSLIIIAVSTAHAGNGADAGETATDTDKKGQEKSQSMKHLTLEEIVVCEN